MLTTLIFLPLLAGLLAAMMPRDAQARTVGLLGTAATFLLSLLLLANFNANDSGSFRYATQVDWLPILHVQFSVGVDGPAVLLVLLTTFLHLMAAVFAQNTIRERERAFYALLLLLEGTVIGAFVSLDALLFYVFFEACLIPSYFLIGIFGGRRRVQAATKFFVYTVVGSLVMLASIIGLYLATNSFEVSGPVGRAVSGSMIPLATQLLLFGGFAIAFAVKTGLFPLHTWLPDTYAEAPPVVTALLSGVLAKLGTYGFYRFCLQAFPDAAARFAPFLVGLGVISIVYGAFIAAAQTDARRVIAYSSISHLGFVVAGLFSLTPEGLSGSILQMVNHGITSGALFLMLGMILARRGTTHLRALGGLWEQMPVFARFFLIVTLSAVGLPLTNGFTGEFLILLGTFQTFPWLAAIGTTGVIWSAIYMFGMFQRAMYGPVDRRENRRLLDLTGTEKAILVPFIALIFLLGIYPAPIFRGIQTAVSETLRNRGEQLTPVLNTPVAQNR